ncbi:MAG: single-stranded DNA-binding protein [Clostridia bacterium]|nr:single-stranded DNA-binding protein [Clostridia bacterium]MBQ9212219.1 single-stranded DNA-binding protein [Clostridia bacterium]
MSRVSNGCHFIGNLTRDPEVTTVGGYTKCTFSVAVQRQKAGQDGVKRADFIPIEAWRTLGENCGKYLTKGRRVAVDCHVQTNTWETEDGKKRFSISFVADDVEFQPGGGKQQGAGEAAQGAGAAAGGFIQVDDDELPF